MLNYFHNCNTVEDVKRKYRELALAYHPDRGGDTETMREINAEYHKVLESLSGQQSKDKKGGIHTYHYNKDVEQAIIDKLDELFQLDLSECTVALIGLWIWVFGETKPLKEQLKACGFKFQGHRQAWSWKPYKGKSRRNPRSLQWVATRYGYRVVTAEDAKKEKTEEKQEQKEEKQPQLLDE